MLRPEQHRLLPGGFVVAAVVVALHLAADHAGFDGVIVILRLREVANDIAVSQNGQGIADGFDLVQVVGNEDDRLALSLQLVHQPVEQLAPLLGKRRGGFVHHQDLRLFHHDLGDLNQLALLEVEGSRHVAGLDVLRPDHIQRLASLLLHRPLADQPQPVPELARLSQEQVFRYGDARDGARLLYDHAHAALQRVDHGSGLPWLAVERHIASVRPLHACDDRGQRGLARAVLADQPPYLAGINVDIHRFQRYSRAEALVHAPDGQDGFHTIPPCGSLLVDTIIDTTHPLCECFILTCLLIIFDIYQVITG